MKQIAVPVGEKKTVTGGSKEMGGREGLVLVLGWFKGEVKQVMMTQSRERAQGTEVEGSRIRSSIIKNCRYVRLRRRIKCELN